MKFNLNVSKEKQNTVFVQKEKIMHNIISLIILERCNLDS